jgi:hypothetical protein
MLISIGLFYFTSSRATVLLGLSLFRRALFILSLLRSSFAMFSVWVVAQAVPVKFLPADTVHVGFPCSSYPFSGCPMSILSNNYCSCPVIFFVLFLSSYFSSGCSYQLIFFRLFLSGYFSSGCS